MFPSQNLGGLMQRFVFFHNLHSPAILISPNTHTHTPRCVTLYFPADTHGVETLPFPLAPRDRTCDQVERGADEKSLKSPSLPSNEQSVSWKPSPGQHGSSHTHTHTRAKRNEQTQTHTLKSRGSGPKSRPPLSNFKRSPGVLG